MAEIYDAATPHRSGEINNRQWKRPELQPTINMVDATVRYMPRTGQGSGTGFTFGPMDLRVDDGERVAVVGRSGEGKSTLINVLAGMTQVTSGSVEILGENVSRMSDSRRAQMRSGDVGVVHQEFNVIDYLSVQDNVDLPKVFSPRRKGFGTRADSLPFGMEEYRYTPVAKLSGGQKQRVALARAVLQGAKILLCDEPTAALDPITAADVVSSLGRAIEEGVRSLIVVTHDIDVAVAMDRVVVVSGGRPVATLVKPSKKEILGALEEGAFG